MTIRYTMKFLMYQMVFKLLIVTAQVHLLVRVMIDGWGRQPFQLKFLWNAGRGKEISVKFSVAMEI